MRPFTEQAHIDGIRGSREPGVMETRLAAELATHVGRGDGIELEVAGDVASKVTISRSEDHSASLVLQQTRPVSAKRLHMLEQLAAGDCPEGTVFKGDTFEWTGVGEDGRFDPARGAPYQALPPSLKDLYDEVAGDMLSTARHVVRLLHWRFGLDQPRREFTKVDLSWSLDGDVFVPMNLPIAMTIEIQGGLPLDDDSARELGELLQAGVREPLPQELLRDARSATSPRASLVVAVAALEVAVKRLVQHWVPDSEWLLENVASPPVEKLLVDYLPTIAPADRYREALKLPPDVVDEIKKAVLLRNRVVHTGQSVTATTRASLFATINRVLRVLEYCAGYEWALEYAHDDE